MSQKSQLSLSVSGDLVMCVFICGSLVHYFLEFGGLGADLVSVDMESHFSLDVSSSTGYLGDDAIAGWSNRFKLQQSVQWLDLQHLDDQVNHFLDITCVDNFFSDVYSIHSLKTFRNNEISTSPVESSYRGIKQEQSQSPCSLQRCIMTLINAEDCGVKKIAYPFDMVKRGGIEGHATLEDINYHLRMPPTRPIRHPVGDFAATPCISAGGFGMSGKAVVALTKIHTQGRGTITVIRTGS